MTSTPTTARQIGDRPLSLAGHLRRAADLLLDTTTPSTYNWGHHTSCNCGMVARVILNDPGADSIRAAINVMLNRRHGLPDDTLPHTRCFRAMFGGTPLTPSGPPPTWSTLAATQCSSTGAAMPEVFAKLLAAGLEVADLSHLEYLNHPGLVDLNWVLSPLPGECAVEASVKDAHYTVAANAAWYLLSWAKAIEAFHAAAPAEQTADPQHVVQPARELVAVS